MDSDFSSRIYMCMTDAFAFAAFTYTRNLLDHLRYVKNASAVLRTLLYIHFHQQFHGPPLAYLLSQL